MLTFALLALYGLGYMAGAKISRVRPEKTMFDLFSSMVFGLAIGAAIGVSLSLLFGGN